MSIDEADAALRIVEAGRRRVSARLKDAFERQISTHAGLEPIDPEALDRLAGESADRAGASLWRIALAEGAAEEFHIGIAQALGHPALLAAEQLIGAPPEPLPTPADAGLPLEVLGALSEPADGSPAAWGQPDGQPAADPGFEPDPPAAESYSDPVADAWGAPFEDPPAAESEYPATEPEYPAAEPEYPAAEPGYAAAAPEYGATDPEYAATESQFGAAPEYETAPEYGAPPEYGDGTETEAPDAFDDAAAAPEPAYAAEPEPEPAAPQALRVAAVHTSGIESLKAGDKDLELRISDAGLDVLKASTGVAIGRLEWSEITSVEVAGGRRGLRRKGPSLEVETARGQAAFELPGLTESESAEHLQPMLERLRASGRLAG